VVVAHRLGREAGVLHFAVEAVQVFGVSLARTILPSLGRMVCLTWER